MADELKPETAAGTEITEATTETVETIETGETTEASETEVAPADLLAMSDEEIANLNSPSEVTAAAPAAVETDDKSGEDTTSTDTTTDAGEGDAAAAAEASAEAAGGKAEPEAKAGDKADTTDTSSTAGSVVDKSETQTKETSTEQKTVDYELSYKKIMAPFKANGKLIEPRTPDEAIQLMQMGANYTRKLQELQPHRKIVTMLSNNDLLDEGKLSYLIDLDKGDPEAIKKLIRDKGIDVLDIDTTVEPAYQPGSHQVTDAEINFRSVTEELVSQPDGRETISMIHDKWDDASKQALWEDPSVMAVIHEQRKSGVYDIISEEVDRQITLGNIPPNTPFLEAYTSVGDAMVAQANQTATADQGGTQTGTTEELTTTGPQPIASRAAAPKPALANDEKAKAASSTRAAPKKAEVFKNPLSESDDEFLKSMSGRL